MLRPEEQGLEIVHVFEMFHVVVGPEATRLARVGSALAGQCVSEGIGPWYRCLAAMRCLRI